MLVNTDFESYQPDNMPGVEVQVRPLNMGAYQAVARLVPRMMAEAGDHGGAAMISKLGEDIVIETARKVLPDHVGQIKGIQIRKAGQIKDAVVEDLLQEGAFLPFNLTLMVHLFHISNPTEREAGN